MSIRKNLWKIVDGFTSRENFRAAIQLLENELTRCESRMEWAEVTYRLATLYRYGLKDEGDSAAQYALIAGQSYLLANNIPQALFVYRTLAGWPNTETQMKKLKSWIAKAQGDLAREEIPSAPVMVPRLLEEHRNQLKKATRTLKRMEKTGSQDFPPLTSSEMSVLMDLAEPYHLQEGDLLFREGSESQNFFIIVRGRISIESSAGLRKVFRDGDFFGELAAFTKVPRTASARAITQTDLLCFDRKAMDKAIAKSSPLRRRLQDFFSRRFFLSVAGRSVFFQSLSEKDLHECFEFFKPLKISKNKWIIREGNPSKHFFLILYGHCEAYRDQKFLRRMGPGQFFGEMGLLTGAPRSASIRNISDCGLLACNEKNFSQLLKRFPKLKRIFAEVATLRDPKLKEKLLVPLT